MSRFDEELLQRAETFNMKSFILKIKTHFTNQYEINCIQVKLYFEREECYNHSYILGYKLSKCVLI